MKNGFLKRGIALTLSLLFVFLSACTQTAPSETGTDAESVAETYTHVDTESFTDAETDALPAETETEAETESSALFESADVRELSSLTVQGVSPLLTERETKRDGVGNLKKINAELTYSSVFYGHESAINRDYLEYGWKYLNAKCKQYTDEGQIFVARLTGGYYADFISIQDGTLIIRSLTVTKTGTFDVNGHTYTSVYGSNTSMYGISDTTRVPLGIDAVLRGTGYFNDDSYTDLVLVTPDGTLILAFGQQNGFTLRSVGQLHTAAENLYAGDINGDGLSDLLCINSSAFTPIWFDGQTYTVGQTVTSPLYETPYRVTVGDVNNDKRVDILLLYGEKHNQALSLFGRGDGFFGPHDDEVTNTNLFGQVSLRTFDYDRVALGDVTGDGIDDILLTGGDTMYICVSSGEPAYDYSIFGMEMADGTYRIYAGGRWSDRGEAVSNSTTGGSDGDHVMLYTSEDGKNWLRYIDGPTFYLGYELGIEDWWSSNTLEPEVIYADGVYHMFIQSSNVTASDYYGDYINYASSTDGIHFTRKTDSPVILPAPGYTYQDFKNVIGAEIGFNHEEVIYVPDDPDGKCFWMYTGHFLNNQFSGYVRIRSADPTVFYWCDSEATSGFSEIGNQIAYINNYDGRKHKLFLRITFTTLNDADGSRFVPTFQYSNDGLNFYSSDIKLACVDITDPLTENNHNAYFLGFCTLNGTGEIRPDADGKFRLTYLATTANDSVVMPIFFAEGGAGEVTFTVSCP